MSSLTSSDIKKMKVGDLKTALQERGLDPSGLKADLIARLEAHLTSPRPTQPKPAPVMSPLPVAAAKPPSSLGTTEHKATASSPAPLASTSSPSSSALSLSPALPAASSSASSSSAAASQPVVPVVPAGSSMEAELEARKRRAEKFGTEVKLSDDDKRKLREARFGPVELPAPKKQKTDGGAAAPTTTAAAPVNATTDAAAGKGKPAPAPAAAKPSAAVADPAEEERRKARAARFAAPAVSS